MDNNWKSEIIAQYATHEGDTGSPEVQAQEESCSTISKKSISKDTEISLQSLKSESK